MSSGVSEEDLIKNIKATREKKENILKTMGLIETFLKDVSECKRYTELVKDLELVRYDRFIQIMDIINNLSVVKESGLSKMLEDLTLLCLVLSAPFYERNMYSMESLNKIKFCSENIYAITQYLYSPEITTKLVPFKDASFNDLVKGISEQTPAEDLIRVRTSLYELLSDTVYKGNMYSPIRENF